MRISVSIFTPNAFSMRNAMSPDRSALPFSRFDNVGRDTPSTFAAAATDRPSGVMISVRMKSPGCGGFSMRMVVLRSVVVLIVHVQYLVLGGVYRKGHLQQPCPYRGGRRSLASSAS